MASNENTPAQITLPEAPQWIIDLCTNTHSIPEQISTEKQKNSVASELLDRIETSANSNLYHEFTQDCERYLLPDVYGGDNTNYTFDQNDRVSFIMSVIHPQYSHLDKLRVLSLVGRIIQADLAPEAALHVLTYFDPSKFGTHGGSGNMFSSSEVLAESRQGLCFNVSRLNSETELLLLYKSIQAMLLAGCQRLEEAQDILCAMQKQIKCAISVKPVLKSSMHAAFVVLAQKREEPTELYRQTLFYLAYTRASTLSFKERYNWALFACLSALISNDIYNFGEVMHQPVVINTILSCDDGEQSSRRWLKELLEAFHAGDALRFERALNQSSPYIQELKLDSHVNTLRRKMAVVALLRLAFTRTTAGQNSQVLTSPSRSLPFSVIASTCKVNLDDVERLVMSAFAKGLMKGAIDETCQLVYIKWVKPILLIDQQSLTSVHDRLCRWSKVVENVHGSLRTETAEILGG